MNAFKFALRPDLQMYGGKPLGLRRPTPNNTQRFRIEGRGRGAMPNFVSIGFHFTCFTGNRMGNYFTQSAQASSQPPLHHVPELPRSRRV